MSEETQIEKLANFIMNEFPGEPSQNQGAVDTAIRLLRQYLVVMAGFDIEVLSALVHNAWYEEKHKQGFHSPKECPNRPSPESNLISVMCPTCHPDMLPYALLPEQIKEYDRVTVRAIVKEIKQPK